MRYLSILLFLLFSAGYFQAQQLLLNPGFESGNVDWVSNGAGTTAITNNSANARSGNWYAELTSTGATGSVPNLYASNSTGNRFFPVAPGDVLNWGGYVERLSGNGYARFKLAVYDSNKANPSYLNPTVANATSIGVWTQTVGTYTVPAGKAFVVLYAEIYGATAPSDVRIDDATLVDTPASTATLTSISVTPSNSTLSQGTTLQFTATGTYSNGTSANITTSASWSSGNTSVATVSNTAGSQGLVSAVGAGSTTISAASGGVTGSTGLTVSTTSSNATVNIDFNSRSGGAVIPPSMLGAYVGYLSSAGMTMLQQANYKVIRMDSKFSSVFAAGASNPDWINTKIDDTVSKLKANGFKPMISVEYVPYWLSYTSCNTGTNTAPTSVSAWAGLAAKLVQHMDLTFPGLVTYYEIWNEPNVTFCYPPNDTTAGRVAYYTAMYGAAASAMRTQNLKDQKINTAVGPIKIGGPAASDLGSTLSYLPVLLNDSTANPYVDFVSYHKYLAGSIDVRNGEQWDVSVPTATKTLYDREQDAIIPPGSRPCSVDPTQGYCGGVAASSIKVTKAVNAGHQPNPTQTPIIVTEYNDNWSFSNDCCRNSLTYSPLFNSLWIIDQLNVVYSGYRLPAALLYFSATTPTLHDCLVGLIDASMDCNGSASQGYPQYWTYKLIGGSGYLNMQAGGNMAKSVSSTSPIAATGFYTAAGDSILITNPHSPSVNVTINLANVGAGVSSTGTQYLLNKSNTTISPLSPITFGPGSTGLTAVVNIPGYSVIGIKLH